MYNVHLKERRIKVKGVRERVKRKEGEEREKKHISIIVYKNRKVTIIEDKTSMLHIFLFASILCLFLMSGLHSKVAIKEMEDLRRKR